MATPEARVKARIKKWLKDHGIYHVSVIPSPMGGTNGTPDILCCVNGHFVGVEVKADEHSRVTDLQRHRLSEIKACGGTALVVWEPEGQLYPVLLRLLAA